LGTGGDYEILGGVRWRGALMSVGEKEGVPPKQNLLGAEKKDKKKRKNFTKWAQTNTAQSLGRPAWYAGKRER